MKSVDVILSPTTPGTSFKTGEKTSDPIEMYLQDIFTVHANITGHPAISIPFGTHSNGMPFGLQLMEFFTQTKVVIERWPKSWSRKF